MLLRHSADKTHAEKESAKVYNEAGLITGGCHSKPDTTQKRPTEPDKKAECKNLCVNVWNISYRSYISGRPYLYQLPESLNFIAEVLKSEHHQNDLAKKLTSALEAIEYLSSFVQSREVPPLTETSAIPRCKSGIITSLAQMPPQTREAMKNLYALEENVENAVQICKNAKFASPIAELGRVIPERMRAIELKSMLEAVYTGIAPRRLR